jgi:dTDP-4-dehydrorhamnose 3,5-epimerase-like enzyme
MSNYKLIKLKICGDKKGSLIPIEPGVNLPFKIKRVYYIFDTKKGVERGFHAHFNLKQLVISVKGSCDFIIDNGEKRESIKLNKPNKGLYLDGVLWREMKNFSSDCVLMVLANELYSKDDYIKDYKKFLKIVKN